MNRNSQINLIKYGTLACILLSAPMTWYQFQAGEPLEALKTLGWIAAAFAFFIQPEAFVAVEQGSKTMIAAVSTTQKSLFLAALLLILLPFVGFYVTGFGEIL